MKRPLAPPPLSELFSCIDIDRFMALLDLQPGPSGRVYLHWDKLRHLAPPEGISHEEWWVSLKLGRQQNRREISGLLSTSGKPFYYTLPDCVLEAVHDIDSRARGQVAVIEKVTNPADRDRYVISSLIEEAITSSQLEGAATTRKIAAEMLRSGRPPRDHSEQMILNNYRAMQHIRGMNKERLTSDDVRHLHRIVAERTLENPDAAGQLQRESDERVNVVDNRDNVVLHRPPPASELPDRLQRMCEFASGEIDSQGFLHPVIRAIVLHFWLAYDHPFEDGNGRTARALFYWAMLRNGYWLFEYVSISSRLRKAPAQYSRSFQYTETDDNDLTYFIDAQLTVLRKALDALEGYLARKTREIHETESRIREMAWLNSRQRALIAHALRHSDHHYTIESHRRSHGVVYATARSDLLQLVEKGLLAQSRQGRKMVFWPALPEKIQ